MHTCARANEELRKHLHADHVTGTPSTHMNMRAQELEETRDIYSLHGNRLEQRQGHLQTLPLSRRTRMTKQQKQA